MNNEPFPPFETSRLILRPITVNDTAALSALITPEVSRWMAHWPYPFTPEMAAERIERIRSGSFKKWNMFCAMALKTDGKLIGWISAGIDKEGQRTAGFGYCLGEEYHNKGYIKEAAPVMLKKAFECLGLDKVEAGSQPENSASIKILKGCGMRPIGERMIYVSARDREELCYYYEIERSEVLNTDV